MRVFRSTLTLAAAILAATAIFCTSGALAQEVAICNLEKAMTDSKKGKAASDKIKSREEALAKEFEAKFKALEKKFNDYEKQASTMNQEARQKKEQELIKERDDLQAQRQKALEELQTTYNDNIRPLLEKAQNGARDLARANGYKVVLEMQQAGVIYFDSAADITADITKAIDK
jgi:Skp family chaperone for outer membrane proteins